MKIMLFDVPAEFGGALTILNEYYEKAKKDIENKWIFVLSTPKYDDYNNVKVLNFPWVQKNWLYRLFFVMFTAKKLIKKYNPDKVISLQNTIVNAKGKYQELYLHQSLPFCEKRFSLFQSKTVWLYQNIISKLIFYSLKKADSVIVQTNWMKKSIIQKCRIDESKIKVEMPEIMLKQEVQFKQGDSIVFFYPTANKAVYKNHLLIFKSVHKLVQKGYSDFTVVLTIKPTQQMSEFLEKNKLPIIFTGYLTQEEMNDYYSKSVLIFPSYIETVGLPLLEARNVGCPIIVSDCGYSREILSGYENVTYFNPDSENELAEHMMNYMDKVL